MKLFRAENWMSKKWVYVRTILPVHTYVYGRIILKGLVKILVVQEAGSSLKKMDENTTTVRTLCI